MKYAIDAQYVKQQSLNGRKSQELRCQRKELTAKDISYGYEWHKDTKTITINEKQADIVRWIFEEYVYRDGISSVISEKLKGMGVTMCPRTVRNIIVDERYIGNFYINKRTSKLGTGKNKSQRIPLPKEQWVLCERPDLQIVDTDLFNLAQRVHSNRIMVFEKPEKRVTRAYFKGTHTFASKVFCPICGQPYQFGYSDRAKTIPMYTIKKHSDCTNPVRKIREEDLNEITKQALIRVFEQKHDVITSLEQTLAEVITTYQSDNGESVEKLKKQRTIKEKQLDNLIDQLSSGGLTGQAATRIKTKINVITEEVDSLSNAITIREQANFNDSFKKETIVGVKSALNNLSKFDSIDRKKVQTYIQRIDMPPSGNIVIMLKSGEKTETSSADTCASVRTNGIQDVPY